MEREIYHFRLDEAVPLLARTPRVVVGHLIHGEKTDWLPRARMILEHGDAAPFPAFDRFAQLKEPAPSSIDALDASLGEFARRRAQSLAELAALKLTPSDLARRGRHPEFGPVTLGQHLSTWVAHDLTHLFQIEPSMAKRYAKDVGPWAAYLRIVR